MVAHFVGVTPLPDGRESKRVCYVDCAFEPRPSGSGVTAPQRLHQSPQLAL